VVRPQYKLSLKGLDILKIFLAGLSGFLPYIIQNICTQGSEIRGLFHAFLFPADGSTNLDYFKHLYTRFMQLGDALGGISFCEENVLWAGGIKKAIVIAFLVIVILALAQGKLKEKKVPLLFLLICILSFMFGVTLNGSGLGYNHVFPIVPLVVICCAVVLVTLIRRKFFLFLSVFLMLTPDFFIIMNYQRNLQQLGDNSIIGFSNYLLSQGFFSPIFISQLRLANLVAITTHGKVFPVEAQSQYLMKRGNEWLNDRKNVYILARDFFPPSEEEEKKAYAIFNEMLRKNGRRIYILKEYPIDSTSVYICKTE
jgi:hypothetical protein